MPLENASSAKDQFRHYVLVLSAALVVAAISARPYAGSWNEGSRLAAVEALVDHGTFSIDDSIFVKVAGGLNADAPSPYPVDNPFLKHGTLDKLLIDGHFYSDKPPVQSLLLAGVYQVWQWLGGPLAHERPDLFCYLMTLLSSGLAYVVAVGCLYRLGHLVGLTVGLRVALTASFALGTVALTYSRHVNGHIAQLGVVMALLVALVPLARTDGQCSWPRLLWIGTLGGLAYSLDLGVGPVLLVCLVGLIVYRCRRLKPVMLFGLGALPWLVTHHAFNYAIGGTLGPANKVAEYLQWPGTPFAGRDVTGGWHHSFGHFWVYAAAMLFGKRGLFGHNLPLFLALPGFLYLLRKRERLTAELVFGLAWCAGSWLLYAAFSTNYSGACCSIRWFVPFLGPFYLALALLLARDPAYRWDFYTLSAWGMILGGIMWWQGPWMIKMMPLFWPIQAAALLTWLAVRLRMKRRGEVMFERERQQRPLAA
jgi:hypothetical protein